MATQIKSPATRDPSIALLISVAGLFVAAPGIGYLYLNDMRKAVIYILGFWAVLAVAGAMVFVWSFVSNEALKAVLNAMNGLGAYQFYFSSSAAICNWPILLPIIAMAFIIIADVHSTAQGENPLLPGF